MKLEHFSIFQLGIFAGGLSSFVSEDTEITKNDEPNANAGLSLKLLNHQVILLFSEIFSLLDKICMKFTTFFSCALWCSLTQWEN